MSIFVIDALAWWGFERHITFETVMLETRGFCLYLRATDPPITVFRFDVSRCYHFLIKALKP